MRDTSPVYLPIIQGFFLKVGRHDWPFLRFLLFYESVLQKFTVFLGVHMGYIVSIWASRFRVIAV